mgnify:CR=1 FL=1
MKYKGPLSLKSRMSLIRHAAKAAQAWYRDVAWIENDEAGFTGWRWDKYNVVLKIVTAANRYGDYIVIGARHHGPTMHFATEALGLDALHQYAREFHGITDPCVTCEEQGFIDQYGTYWNRVDAMAHCLKTGQPLDYERGRSTDRLFSEHLH